MKICILIVFSFFFTANSSAQDFKEKFERYYSKEDTLEQRKLLEEWQRSNANDPELCAAWFNYYFQKSKSSKIILGNDPKGDDVLEIKSMDSTKQEPLAFLYENTAYDPEYLEKAYAIIDKGIKNFPLRLDFRFGKIYLLGEVKAYEKFTTEIIKTINYSNQIQNKWTWSENKPVEELEKFMLDGIQGYQLTLYNTENDSLLDNMERIANAILKFYPQHVESLSNLAIVYLLKKDYDKALTVLLRAEKINPEDAIVLNNIAHAYKLKGDKKNAIKYYELTLKYGNGDERKFAKQQIELLKAKK